MSLFICEKCHCIENTACGWYWTRNIGGPWFKPEHQEDEGKAMCSKCAPAEFVDGGKTGYGKWHGKFPRKTYEEWGRPGDVINLEDFISRKG
jgi:hypothetical protein